MTLVSVKVSDVSLQVPVFVQGERDGRGWLSTLLSAALDPPRRRFRMLSTVAAPRPIRRCAAS
ncbi:MAG: hypothetical protein ABIO58_07270, partial [Luteimonas sp.]